MSTVVTKAAYARHRGWARSTVTRALARGRLVATDDGRIDLEASDALYASTATHAPRSPGAGDPSPAESADDAAALSGLPSATASRARREHFEAELKELDYRQRIGDLIPRDDCDATLRFAAAALRAQLDVFPDQTAPLVAPVTSLDEVHALLSEACRQVLVDVSESVKRQCAALDKGAGT